jgi:hypothetical protein
MIGKIGDLLLRPDFFFAGQMKEPESLRLPGLIAVIGGIIAAAAAYVISGTYSRMLSELTGALAPLLGIFGAVSAFLGFIIIWWIIFSGVFYVISMAFAGKGTFKRTLEYIGFGLIPIIIGSAISLLISLYYIPLIEIPVISSVTDPTAIQEAMNQVLQDPVFREFTLISSIVSVIFLAWSANLWIFGMKHARSLTTKHAVIVVLVPVIIYIIYILFMAFGAFQIFGGA